MRRFDSAGFAPLRARRQVAALLVLTLGLGPALATGGCSLSIPMSSLSADDAPTGSIAQPAATLSSNLDGEDWRRARAALAVALDPQGNGAEATWSNPQSGAKGSFAAAAAPFMQNDRLCRDFDARLSIPPRPERRLGGSACRDRDGEWVLNAVKERRGA